MLITGPSGTAFGSGRYETEDFASPGFGNPVDITITRALLSIVRYSFTLTTSGVPGNRVCATIVYASDGVTVLYRALLDVSQGPGITADFAYHQGTPLGGTSAGWKQNTLPVALRITDGCRIVTNVGLMDVSDLITNVKVSMEVF